MDSMIKFPIIFFLFLFSLSVNAAAYFSISENKCDGDFLGGKSEISSTLEGKYVEVKIKMPLPGGKLLINPKVGFSEAGVTFSVTSGTTDGSLLLCLCEQRLTFKLKHEEVKRFEELYFIIDNRVMSKVKIPNQSMKQTPYIRRLLNVKR